MCVYASVSVCAYVMCVYVNHSHSLSLSLYLSIYLSLSSNPD